VKKRRGGHQSVAQGIGRFESRALDSRDLREPPEPADPLPSAGLDRAAVRRHLDRHLVRDFLLRLAHCAPLREDGRSYSEQYAWLREHTDPASPFEREFLDYLFGKKLKFPDFAQFTPASDVLVQPDFYYRRGEMPGVCVFIGQPPHIEKVELMVLDERDDDFGAPPMDGVSVDVEVAIPAAVRVLLARAQGHPDVAGKIRRREGGNVQGVRETGFHGTPQQ
jgi:hypothetical protein